MDESALRSVLASVNDCGSLLHRELLAWTFLVAFGVALEIVFVVWEYVEDLHDFRRGIVHPPDRPNLLLFVLGFVGAALVAVGVSGELYTESKIATLETCIRTGNDALSLLLSKEAGDAAKSAETAHDEADAVKLEADAIKKRLDAASAQLSVIEQEVRVQGPRWKLLEAGKDEVIAKLKPFAGQKVFIMYCGRWGGIAPEQFRVTQDLFTLLTFNEQAHEYGAGWNVNGGTWDQCPAGGGTSAGGNLVVTSSDSGRQVEDAAQALYEILNKLQISTIKLQADPQEANQDSLTVHFLGPGSPWQIAAKDPSLVVILVGDNPMFDLAGWSKRQKKPHK